MPWFLKVAIVMSIFLLLAYAYVAARISASLRRVTDWNPQYVKLAVVAVLLYLLVYPILGLIGLAFGVKGVYELLRGGNPLTDALFFIPFWVGLVYVLQVGIVLLIADIVRGAVSFARPSRREAINFIHAWIIIVVAALAALYIPVKIYFDTNTIRTDRLSAQIPDLPEELAGFRIAHITDIQADRFTDGALMERYVEAVNALDPDIVVFSGDLVTAGADHIEAAAAMMGQIRSKHGVYAALGDHDHWADAHLVIGALRKNGVVIEEDQNIFLHVGESEILLTVSTNIYSKKWRRETLSPLTNHNTAPDLKIFLTHQPGNEIVEFASEHGYDLFLGGHTHGGQVVFPLFGLKLCPAFFETNYISGEYRLGEMFINVNNGLGLTAAPLRYNAPATVSLIELQRGE